MPNNLIRNICISLIVISLFLLGLKNFDNSVLFNNNVKPDKESSKNSPSSRMSYGRFLDYLEMGWVKQVDLYDSGRNAIIQASSPELGNRPQLIRVEIPVGASQLILKLK
jgi:cell division protease FtsH